MPAIDAITFNKLGDVPRLYAEKIPNRIALTFEGRDITYAELNANTNRLAQGLISYGVTLGSRVGYLGKNRPEYWEILLSLAKIGGVITPVNWRLAVPEITYILENAEVEILFLGKDFADLAEPLSQAIPGLKFIIPVEYATEHHASYENWRDSFEDIDPQVEFPPSHDMAQLYTSGTTGHPKGVVLSHTALVELKRRSELPDTPEWNTWTYDDVSLVAMPCFHVGGTVWGLNGLYSGARGVIMRDFDPFEVLNFIDQFKISKLFLVPAAMQIVVNQPKAKEVDFSQLKYMLYGASPIPVDLLRKCMDVFGCGFVQMYGMTETAGTVVALPPDDHDPNGNERMRSAGKALSDVQIRIQDETGAPLPVNAVGEIAIKSHCNMTGYWKQSEATAETIGPEGWLRTGDAGYLDEDGYLFIHDRVKDMIISGGENIYPAEVENAIFGMPGIADVAVIGVPDQKWGETVKALVVKSEGSSPSPEDVIEWAKSKIAGYKCPKSVDFIEALPRNASGKILRKDLREPYWEGQTRQVS